MSIFEANRPWNSSIKEKYSSSDKDLIMKYFETFSTKWTVASNVLDWALKNLNITDIDSIDIGILQIEFQKAMYESTLLHTNFKKHITEYDEYKNRWDKIYEAIFYSERLVRDIYLLNKTNDPDVNSLSNEDPYILYKYTRYTDESKKTPYQCLLLYLLDLFSEEGFSRSGGNLYTPFYKNGHNTHSWVKSCSIKEYIYKKTDHKLNFEQWKNATSSGGSNVTNAEKYFNEFIGPELPVLNKDRHLFAFKNGNYITKYNIAPEGGTPIYRDVFVPYGKAHPYINGFSVACKYHDSVFKEFDTDSDDWFENIMGECKTFKSLLDYQEFTAEIQKWLCTFMGRMCFELGDMDNWQVLFYLLGQAGAGKSTVLMKILQKFFEDEDVGIIANNIDSKFGIKPHASKLMVIAPEISENFKMEQTDWQLIVEGGRNTYAEKYKSDETIDWKLPMAMGGNKIMRYKNNSESVSRRTAIFSFWKKVINTDTEADKKLVKEMPYILKMCVTCYYKALEEHGKKGIWNILPKYFHENKEDMEQTTNSLQNFLKSGKVVFGPKLYVPMKIFQQAFNDHCRDNNLGREQFTKDFYGAIFTNNNIKIIQQGSREYPIGSGTIMKRTTFYLGIDIPGDNDNEEDPE